MALFNVGSKISFQACCVLTVLTDKISYLVVNSLDMSFQYPFLCCFVLAAFAGIVPSNVVSNTSMNDFNVLL